MKLGRWALSLTINVIEYLNSLSHSNFVIKSWNIAPNVYCNSLPNLWISCCSLCFPHQHIDHVGSRWEPSVASLMSWPGPGLHLQCSAISRTARCIWCLLHTESCSVLKYHRWPRCRNQLSCDCRSLSVLPGLGGPSLASFHFSAWNFARLVRPLCWYWDC